MLSRLKKILVVSRFIAHTVNTVILAAAFTVFFVPVGLLLRLSGKDLIHRKGSPEWLDYRDSEGDEG